MGCWGHNAHQGRSLIVRKVGLVQCEGSAPREAVSNRLDSRKASFQNLTSRVLCRALPIDRDLVQTLGWPMRGFLGSRRDSRSHAEKGMDEPALPDRVACRSMEFSIAFGVPSANPLPPL
jgi:hypothetical protein